MKTVRFVVTGSEHQLAKFHLTVEPFAIHIRRSGQSAFYDTVDTHWPNVLQAATDTGARPSQVQRRTVSASPQAKRDLVLKTFAGGEWFTMSQVRDLLGAIHRPWYLMRQLREQGIIETRGSKRSMEYRIVQQEQQP